MERTWMRDSLFNMEKGEWIYIFFGGGGVLKFWVSGSGVFEKSVEVQGRGRKIWL